MSFRWRVAFLVVAALTVALVVQAAVGYWLFERALSRDLENDLGRYGALLEQGLVRSPQGLTLTPEAVTALSNFDRYADARGRVLGANGAPVLLFGGRFPDPPTGWRVRRKRLADGFTLEVAMSIGSHNAAVRDYLKVSALGLPVLIVLLGSGALLLAWRLTTPLQRLQRTVEAVSASGNLAARVEAGSGAEEFVRLSRSYNQMMAQLEAFFERERAFTRYASHELRNPLTALQVQVDAALDGDLPTAAVLPTLKSELGRLRGILDGLLILARDQAPPQRSLDLAQLVRESIERTQTWLANLGEPDRVEFHSQLPASLPARGDELLLARLVDNLLENAAKFAPGGIVNISLQQQRGWLRLRVTDQGPGVPAAELSKLTAPFYRSRTPTTPSPHQASTDQPPKPGVGLGLAVVEQIAKVHGGTVKLENLVPNGFSVTVTLPQPPEGSPAPSPPEAAARPTPSRSAPT